MTSRPTSAVCCSHSHRNPLNSHAVLHSQHPPHHPDTSPHSAGPHLTAPQTRMKLNRHIELFAPIRNPNIRKSVNGQQQQKKKFFFIATNTHKNLPPTNTGALLSFAVFYAELTSTFTRNISCLHNTLSQSSYDAWFFFWQKKILIIRRPDCQL